MVSRQRRVSLSYCLNLKEPTFKHRAETAKSSLSSTTRRSHHSSHLVHGRTSVLTQSEDDDTDSTVSTRWKKVIRSNTYYKNTNPKKTLLNTETNSTTCIIQ